MKLKCLNCGYEYIVRYHYSDGSKTVKSCSQCTMKFTDYEKDRIIKDSLNIEV